MHVCLVYDHVFPQTVGGAERWMRDLALHLAGSGKEVTYLTMRHWHGAAEPHLPGVRVVGLTDAGRIWGSKRRTLVAPLRFGFAVARHLAVHGSSYDVVHTASFPYFPLLAAGCLRRLRRYALVVDWHEVWTKAYWTQYAGPLIGTLGWLVQKACVRIRHQAFCMSRLHAERLVAAGYRGTPTILPGLYAGPVGATPADQVDTALVVYAGRQVPEKRVDALLRGFAVARERRPELRLELYGDGPERPRLESLVRALDLTPFVQVLGRRPEDEVAGALAQAACLVTASEKEGYGLVVVEAAAHGTPSVVVAGPDNAATELVHDGVNGFVAGDASPVSLSDAITRVVDAGPALRESTARWFAANAPKLRIDRSLELVAARYDSRSEARG